MKEKFNWTFQNQERGRTPWTLRNIKDRDSPETYEGDYQGQLKNGEPHGFGKFIIAKNLQWIEAEWQHG